MIKRISKKPPEEEGEKPPKTHDRSHTKNQELKWHFLAASLELTRRWSNGFTILSAKWSQSILDPALADVKDW